MLQLAARRAAEVPACEMLLCSDLSGSPSRVKGNRSPERNRNSNRTALSLDHLIDWEESGEAERSSEKSPEGKTAHL